MSLISKCQDHSGNTIGMTRKKIKDKETKVGHYAQNCVKNNNNSRDREKARPHERVRKWMTKWRAMGYVPVKYEKLKAG